MTPEGAVKKAVRAWLVERGWYYYMPVSNGMGRTGVPDFIVCAGGRFVAIETKAPGKRGNVSLNQNREIKAINMAGGTALVVDHVSQLEFLTKLGGVCVNKPKAQEGHSESA